MPIKQVYESDPGVYRVGLRSGLPDAWAGQPEQTRIYDEYLWWGMGLFVIENPESPTDYEIVFFCLNHERSAGLLEGANATALRFSGLTGEFIGHHDTNGWSWIDIRVGANGSALAASYWITGYDGIIYRFNRHTWDFEQAYPSGHFVGLHPSRIPCVDEAEDLALFIGGGTYFGDQEVAVYRNSTGAHLYNIKVCGVADTIFMTDDRRAYVVSTDNSLTLFDYTNGQVLGLLHVGFSPYVRFWAWDRVAKRVLCMEITPDTLPEGHCTLRVRGYYPIPVAHGMVGPIPLQAPAVGRRVEWLTKVYGVVGEGIPGVQVNYSLDTPTSTTLSPVQHTTDLNGNSRTYVTSSLAGDNELTATAEV